MHHECFGELSHDDLVGFGKHAELTYAHVKRESPGYCSWVLTVPDARGALLLRFREYLRLARAGELEAAIARERRAREQRDRLERERKDRALAVAKEKTRVAQLRRSTARGQVLALFHDPSFVDRALLSRLPFGSLCALPSVCKELSRWRREERRTYLGRLSTAAAEREPDQRKATGIALVAHLRRAYGIPNGWKVSGLLGGAGLEAGLRLGDVAALRRDEYKARKAEVGLAIRAWKGACLAATTSIGELENSRALFDAVSDRTLELREAVARLAALLAEFGANVPDVPKRTLLSHQLKKLEVFCIPRSGAGL